MTTTLESLMDRRGEHAVGYFTCIVNPRQIDGGAKCAADIDNTELVSLSIISTRLLALSATTKSPSRLIARPVAPVNTMLLVS